MLVIWPNRDYHWYRQDADGTWSHKPGSTKVITGVVDPVADARERGYTSIVGYYYITEACDAVFYYNSKFIDLDEYGEGN